MSNSYGEIRKREREREREFEPGWEKKTKGEPADEGETESSSQTITSARGRGTIGSETERATCLRDSDGANERSGWQKRDGPSIKTVE